jgi:hypothetical protein
MGSIVTTQQSITATQNPGNTNRIPGLPGVSVADIRPPGPSGGFVSTGVEDDTYYLLTPDAQFYRPWIYTPGGSAFIWPGGLDGFQLTSNATAGIHHYLGSNGVHVDLVYPDELHIVLTGTFPGLTSQRNMHSLRGVILQQSTNDNGKILGLPGLFGNFVYGQVINHQFNHDSGDGSKNITYSIEVVKTGFGKVLKTPPLLLPQPNPQAVTQPLGKSQNRVTTKSGLQSLKSIATKVYGDAGYASLMKLVNLNQSVFAALNIATYQAASGVLPIGTTLNF